MKDLTFKTRGKILGLFMTVFTVLGLSGADNAYSATMPEIDTQTKTPLDSHVHGCGCGCSSCIPSSEISKTNKS